MHFVEKSAMRTNVSGVMQEITPFLAPYVAEKYSCGLSPSA